MTVRDAFAAATQGYVPTTRWQQLCGLFHAIDRGHPPRRIPGYNGGLFRPDVELERLVVGEEALDDLLRLSEYDFYTEVNVTILGHVFEQSIADLEALRAEIQGLPVEPRKSKRKHEGIYYTPEFITQYIVANTIGAWLDERWSELEAESPPTKGRSEKQQREDETALWEGYQDVLRQVKVLDPACGSGAFLVAAFDYLHAEYTRVNDRLATLRGGQAGLFDLDRQILRENLFGVDLNPESVEITKLSLWLKTARTDKPLNDLDSSIKCGDSILTPAPGMPPELAARAFDWHAQFPQVFAVGGFDCVIGNPPYIRQEWLTPYKPFLQRHYACYSGTADIYLYFVERGLGVLKLGGRLGYITSGSFNNVNFAVPFRKWLPTVARFTHVVNFGENQPFADAEMVYPTISILVKDPAPRSCRAYFMRERIPASIPEAVASEGIDCDDSVFSREEWRFQPPEVTRLFNRLMNAGKPLTDVVEGQIFYGVKTGLNEAFIIDQATRDRLVATDPGCAPLLRRLLRGEDLRPWYYEDEGRWLILMPCGWTMQHISTTDEAEAWGWLTQRHPSVSQHLAPFADAARHRSDKGRFWWELRPCDYYDAFDQPKVLWPDIAKLPRFCWDEDGLYANNKCYLIVNCPRYVHSVLMSRVSWFCTSQICTPLRLRGGLWQFQPFRQFVERLRVPEMEYADRDLLGELATKAAELARQRYRLHERVRHRVRTDLGDGARLLNTALTAWWELDFRSFRSEVRKTLKAGIPLEDRQDWEDALCNWQAEHRQLTTQLVDIETAINDRVYHLFQLAPAERLLLNSHAQHAMIDYPFGAV